jgi:hypothetical protein
MSANLKFSISIAVVFVMLWFGGFLVHGVFLFNDYAQLPNLMRPQDAFHTLWPFMALARLCQSVALVLIYNKGKEDKPWLPQGIRFGILIALLLMIPVYLIYYVVMPYPLALAIKQMIFDSILIVVIAVVLAWINR